MQPSKAIYLLKKLSKDIKADDSEEMVEALSLAINSLMCSANTAKVAASVKRKPLMSYSGRGDIPGGNLGLAMRVGAT